MKKEDEEWPKKKKERKKGRRKTEERETMERKSALDPGSRLDRDADLIEPGRKINNGPTIPFVSRARRVEQKKRPFVKLFQ